MNKEETRTIPELQKIIISLLFVLSKPVNGKEILKATGINSAQLSELIKSTNQELEKTGLMIIHTSENYELVTQPKMESYLSEFISKKKPTKLGKASLVVISIICYRNGATKEEIDLIRGINSYYILRDLQIKGLIEREKTEKGEIFRPTLLLLKKLGIKNIEELENYEQISKNKDIQELLNYK